MVAYWPRHLRFSPKYACGTGSYVIFSIPLNRRIIQVIKILSPSNNWISVEPWAMSLHTGTLMPNKTSTTNSYHVRCYFCGGQDWRKMIRKHFRQDTTKFSFRAVFKWLSRVITWLRLLRLVIGLKDSRQFFNQWESKPKPIAPRTRDFSRASSELHVIARNCDWFMELSAPVVIGRSNCFGFGFSTVIWKPL